jgi:hypothetical protein
MSDRDNDINDPTASSEATPADATKGLAEHLRELEALLKDGGVIAALTSRGVNASLGLVAVHGLRAYLIEAKKAQAADDFATVSEEIFARLASSVIHESGGGSGFGGGGFGDANGH